jgi:type IV pilus assembly protein PilY1
MAGAAGSAVLSLADAPLGNGLSSTSVKPNVAMVLDDSGSMAFPNMPGGIDDSDSTSSAGHNAPYNITRYGDRCYGHKAYNTLAYDPTITYTPPYDPSVAPDANGNSLKPNASFTAALYDGFFASNASSTYDGDANMVVNLSLSPTTNPIKLGRWPGTSRRVGIQFYYTKRTTTSTTCGANNQYTAVTSASDIEAPGVATGSDAAKTNYANWYSYYRARGLLMKTATGRAFSTVTDNYRVGLFFLNDNAANTVRSVQDFDDTAKLTWFSTLYGSKSNGSTPLRTTLAKVGQMYAGKGGWSSRDPVQYSCQQNFTILSTDGSWNDDSNPKRLNTTTDIGNQDGTGTARPYFDSSNASNTLADTAMYYYKTDLRTSGLSNCSNTIGGTSYTDLCVDNVLGTPRDPNTQQHMTTFTLGLGVNGTIRYEQNYETAPNITNVTQYYDILNSNANWPNPTPTNSDEKEAEKIDDLWHAAVNGRGLYFSANNPTSLVAGLQDALAGISARVGSGTAAATSSLELVAGDNAVYLAQYRTVKWDGDLIAKAIDANTGAVATTASWSARTQLNNKVAAAAAGSDDRTIKYFNSTAADKLKDFTFTNLNADGKGDLFTNACPATGDALSQCTNLTATQKATANTGDNLVKYLRGQNTYEDLTNSANPLYREREYVLGDIVNAVPVFVQKPQFNYEQYDTTYGSFKSTNATRGGNVYVAANDGMLHAFNSANGAERWAFVPSFVMPNMRELADSNYTHRYFVDGSPTVADVCSSPGTGTPSVCSSATAWKTILVAGLDKGGCGYYALDVTDPANPKGLWEFTHDQLGYSYGHPVITRRKDGKWVAIFTSGYNNVPSTCDKAAADGVGRVFVVDAMTGALLDTISTGEGSAETPSNLGMLNAWVEVAELNTADVLYAGDMLGNVWRVDFDDNHAPNGKEAFKLATLRNAAGAAQPISVKPELAYTNGSRVVMVGTGRLLSLADLANAQGQSLYGLKDDLSTTGLGNPRSNANVKSRTLTTTTGSGGQTIRTISGDAINWATDMGWYFDFPSTGSGNASERVNVDMQLQYNILTVATNVPESNACTAGGYGWLYYVDLETGKQVTTATDSAVGTRLSSNTMVSGIKTVKLQNGKTVTIVSDTLGDVRTSPSPSPTGAAAGTPRRTMWRELLD